VCYGCRVRVALLVTTLWIGACGRPSGLDTVVDTSADPGVWRADAQKIGGVLPKAVGAFTPSEAVDPFSTSYRAGPVFGASCVYASGGRQLMVRVETGNIAARSVAALTSKPEADGWSPSRESTVKGAPALVRWSEKGREGEVTFLVDRRYLLQLRLVPAANEGETVTLAEAFDVGPLASLVLDGVK
jgi:hypothetical protein